MYVQGISGALPLKTKVNWKNEAYYSVLFIFQFWEIIMTLSNNLNNTHIWNTIQERTKRNLAILFETL